MTTIRPLARDDLHDVAELYAQVMRDGTTPPKLDLPDFFRRTLLDQPWADPELPSHVAVDGDRIVGFIASNVRRATFDGKPVRMVCSAHLVTHPRARAEAIGARLLKRLLTGPQDVTITDGATETVRRMWEAFGGASVSLGAFTFIRVFRPFALGIEVVGSRHELGPVDRAARLLCRGIDRAAESVAPRRLRVTPSEATCEPLTTELLLEHLPAVTAGTRFHLTYDVRYTTWLLAELGRVETQGPLWVDGIKRGPLFAELVRHSGRVEGWYVCQLRRGGFCRILQFAATPRGNDAVFEQLSWRARALGAAALYGRLEPLLVGPVTATRCAVRPSEGRLLISARDGALVDATRAGDALLTRLDGEWW